MAACYRINGAMSLLRILWNWFPNAVFLIAMDGSHWAIHDSFLAARWRRLANFNYFIHVSYPGS